MIHFVRPSLYGMRMGNVYIYVWDVRKITYKMSRERQLANGL